MAVPAWVIEKWGQLNEEDQKQAETFIDFLLLRHREAKPNHHKIQFGVWKNEPFYIADDFDETPEE